MSNRSMLAKRSGLVLCALIGGAGCDAIAEAGRTLGLGRSPFFGSGGDAQTAPLPAVRVQPTGTVVVQGADVFGGGLLAQQVGQQSFGSAGPGISAVDGNGTVRVQEGLVAGGPVVLQVPGDAFDDPAPGVVAIDSSVEVAGGTVRGGSLVSQVGPIAGGIPGPAIFSDGGMVRVTGGTLTSGSLDPAAEGDDPAVVALDSQLEITGGTFGDEVLTSDGRARIRGGTFEFLELVSSTLEGCSELRGGQVKGLGVIGGRLIVAGTGLALMPTAQPGVSRLTGTLEGGQPVNAEVVLDEGGQVQLVAPGSPGCP